MIFSVIYCIALFALWSHIESALSELYTQPSASYTLLIIMAYTVSQGSNTESVYNSKLDQHLKIDDKPPTAAADYKSAVWGHLQQINSRLDQLPQMKLSLNNMSSQ